MDGVLCDGRAEGTEHKVPFPNHKTLGRCCHLNNLMSYTYNLAVHSIWQYCTRHKTFISHIYLLRNYVAFLRQRPFFIQKDSIFKRGRFYSRNRKTVVHHLSHPLPHHIHILNHTYSQSMVCKMAIVYCSVICIC